MPHEISPKPHFFIKICLFPEQKSYMFLLKTAKPLYVSSTAPTAQHRSQYRKKTKLFALHHLLYKAKTRAGVLSRIRLSQILSNKNGLPKMEGRFTSSVLLDSTAVSRGSQTVTPPASDTAGSRSAHASSFHWGRRYGRLVPP